MADELVNLGNTMDGLHRSANDLHVEADNVVDRIGVSTMEAIPVKKRVCIERKVTTVRSKWKNIITASIRRMELLFENERDANWFGIKEKIATFVKDEQTGYEMIKGVMKNTATGGATGLFDFVKKFMMDLLVFANVLERLDELGKLTVGSAAKIAGMFMTDVFETIVKPMVRQEIIDKFLPALNDITLNEHYFTQFLNVGKPLAITAVACYAENMITGTYGWGAILAQLLYCFNDKWRKDEEEQRQQRAKAPQ